MPESEVPERQLGPSAPRGLGKHGRKLWRKVSEKYALRPDELRILEDAARLVDTIAALEEGMVGQPLTVLGSARQLVAHPLISEIRAHRMALAALLRQLKLPDLDAAAAQVNRHREAALSRWRSPAGGAR